MHFYRIGCYVQCVSIVLKIELKVVLIDFNKLGQQINNCIFESNCILMKFLRLLPLAVFMSFFLVSCNEDIDFTGTASEAPVVYCLLDQNDTLHYVKITRAFAGNNNATEVAQIADSSYYDQVDVKIEQWAGPVKIGEYQLTDTTITGKTPGAFYNPDQKVYYFKEPNLKVTETVNTPGGQQTFNVEYRLIASINNGEFVVNAKTELVQGTGITTPIGQGAYAFVNYNNGTTNYLQQNVKVNAGNSSVVETRLELVMDEYFNGVPVQKSFFWKLGYVSIDNFASGNIAAFKANGETFLNLVKQNVTNDPTITRRVLKEIRLYATCGSSDLNTYMIVNQPSSSLAQTKPTYTNLTTSDNRPVIGIFSSRSTVIQKKIAYNPMAQTLRAFDKNTTRELCIGPITGNLLFCSEHINDNTETYHCN